MIERRTVLVLGAGASAPYGLPVGATLRSLILSMDVNDMQREATGKGRQPLTRAPRSSNLRSDAHSSIQSMHS